MVGLTFRVIAIAEATMTGGNKNQPTTTTSQKEEEKKKNNNNQPTTSHNQQNLLWPCEILKADAFIGYIYIYISLEDVFII